MVYIYYGKAHLKFLSWKSVTNLISLGKEASWSNKSADGWRSDLEDW